MRFRRIRIEKKKMQRGFTLLLAAIISSIAIALGAAIFDIAQKQVTLSSTARQSQFAFYAADTAAECALYWDIRCQYFATSTPSTCTESSGATITMPPTCDGQPFTVTTSGTNYPYTKTFQFQPNGLCANVTVTKQMTAQNSVQTSIEADGYNVACSVITSSNLTLERSVELDY